MTQRWYHIDWTSKLIDLLIVIIGITIAFKLNAWNESTNTSAELKSYLESFEDETAANMENLAIAIDHSHRVKVKMDTLKQILAAGDYDHKDIESLAVSMMSLASFDPSTTTMDNITASGQFELIRKVELRRDIIDNYKGYKTAKQLEGLVYEYVKEYATPFFFEHVRFNDPASAGKDFLKDPKFENIVYGYAVLLDQQIKGYENSREKGRKLAYRLQSTNKDR